MTIFFYVHLALSSSLLLGNSEIRQQLQVASSLLVCPLSQILHEPLLQWPRNCELQEPRSLALLLRDRCQVDQDVIVG
jgi:hypothetical protein